MKGDYKTVSRFNVEITENINNRIKNYIYFLKNIHQFEALFRFNNPREISIKDLISILYADKIEGMFAIYEKIESFKYLRDWEDEERVKYLNKVFELYNRSMLVRELKTSFVSTVPRAKLLFKLDSLEALTGIRLMQISDTGDGIFNIISSFSTEEIKRIGELFFELHFLLDNLESWEESENRIKRLFEYRENKELALEENMEVIEDRSIYTVDVLRNLDYEEIYLVIGEDALKQFHLWKDYKEILEKVHLFVFSRGERVEVDFPFIRLEMNLDISSTQFRKTKDFNLLNKSVEKLIAINVFLIFLLFSISGSPVFKRGYIENVIKDGNYTIAMIYEEPIDDWKVVEADRV